MSPDGRLLAYMEISPATATDIWVVPLDLGDPDRPVAGSSRPVLQTPASEEGPAFSPDGNWLAYSSTESGQAEVYARSMGADTKSGRCRGAAAKGPCGPAMASGSSSTGRAG